MRPSEIFKNIFAALYFGLIIAGFVSLFMKNPFTILTIPIFIVVAILMVLIMSFGG